MKKFLWLANKNNFKISDNIRKITTGQGNDYPTECLLDCNYCKEHYNLTAIDLCSQQNLDADPKPTQQINSTGNI